MSCPIDKAIAFDCAALPQGGVEAQVIQINFDDYRQAKIDGGITVDANGEITGIVLPTGKQGYKWTFPKGSNLLVASPLRQVDGIDGYDHSVTARLATIEALDLAEVSKMRFNKVVSIVTLSEGRSQIYGGNVGLRLSQYDAQAADAGTGGTVNFTAMTDAREAAEINVPDVLANTFDLATLLVPAT